MDNTSVLKMNNRTNRVSCIFSAYVVIIPVIQYYKSPFSFFNLATFFALIFGLCFALYSCSSTTKKAFVIKMEHSTILLYILFLWINVVITSYLYSYNISWQNLSTVLRATIIIVGLVIFGSDFFDLSKARKALMYLVLISSILIIFQNVVYIFTGNRIVFIVKNLLSNSGYGENVLRFSGIYMEPAHFAQSATIYLIISLFIPGSKQFRLTRVHIIIIAGIILSGSGQGYLYLTVFILFSIGYYLYITKATKERVLKVLFVVLFLSVLIAIVLNLSIVKLGLSRLYSDDGSIGGVALAGRTWTNDKFSQLPEIQKWTGVGYGHLHLVTTGYVNGMYSSLMQCGYPSLFFLYYIFYKSLFKMKITNRIITVLFIGLTSYAGVTEPTILSLFVLFAYANYEQLASKGQAKDSNPLGVD